MDGSIVLARSQRHGVDPAKWQSGSRVCERTVASGTSGCLREMIPGIGAWGCILYRRRGCEGVCIVEISNIKCRGGWRGRRGGTWKRRSARNVNHMTNDRRPRGACSLLSPLPRLCCRRSCQDRGSSIRNGRDEIRGRRCPMKINGVPQMTSGTEMTRVEMHTTDGTTLASESIDLDKVL